mgnify:CR=1 FL=1
MSRGNKLALLGWLLLAGTALLLAALPQYRQLLMFLPQNALQQPGWQWLSGHLLHLGNAHLAANLLAMCLLAGIAWRQQQLPQSLLALLVSMLGVDLGLVVQGTVAWYVGLSGALHGVFAWLMLAPESHATGRATLRPLLWLLGIVKIYIDLHTSQHWLDIPTVPQAHLYGFCSGSLLALGSYWRRHASNKPPAINSKPK